MDAQVDLLRVKRVVRLDALSNTLVEAHLWYLSGAAYRTLDRIDGKPNPHWDRMLEHPSYDAYWQAMVPFASGFAKIDIPILTTTGYYDGGQVGALYALTEHERYNPAAEHYLVIGPYDHHTGNRGTVSTMLARLHSGQSIPQVIAWAQDELAGFAER